MKDTNNMLMYKREIIISIYLFHIGEANSICIFIQESDKVNKKYVNIKRDKE